MTSKFNELLGEKLLEHNESDQKINEVSINVLDGKYLGLYFSAHWCPPCRNFTPKLSKIFKEMNNEIKSKLDIVFISWDQDQETFDEYFNDMPWKALPFHDRERSEKLGEEFHIDGIPYLVVISPSLDIISVDGVDEVQGGSQSALQKWSEGKPLFWSREEKEGEYVWEDNHCSECFLKPLIGCRYGCTNRQCQINVCETCLTKTNHEHPLLQYLIPKQKYPLEKLFSSVSNLLDPNKEEQFSIKTFLENDIKSVGLYFSAHWCPPCRSFTPKLAQLYEEIKTNSKSFEILFVSSDKDEESFNRYRAQMPWPAFPFDSTGILKEYFQISGIPSLIILSSDGTILSRNGRQDVTRIGIEALKTWASGEKLARPSPDEYQWSYVSCDGCQMSPIIGQRYRCDTCGNYDLCSDCQKKGHEHTLTLEPIPNDDEN